MHMSWLADGRREGGGALRENKNTLEAPEAGASGIHDLQRSPAFGAAARVDVAGIELDERAI